MIIIERFGSLILIDDTVMNKVVKNENHKEVYDILIEPYISNCGTVSPNFSKDLSIGINLYQYNVYKKIIDNKNIWFKKCAGF